MWRSGVNLSPKDTICFHHEKLFLSRLCRKRVLMIPTENIRNCANVSLFVFCFVFNLIEINTTFLQYNYSLLLFLT